MAEGSGGKRTTLPWGLTSDALKPNSVQSLSQSKLKAFSLGRTNPLKKSNPLVKKKEQEEKEEAKEVAKAFEEFDSFFKTSSKTAKTFVRGDTINPNSGGSGSSKSSKHSGALYTPTSRFLKEKEKEKEKEEDTSLLPTPPSVTKKPPKKKGTEKKKSILELFREELKRNQEERKERHTQKAKGDLPLDAPEVPPAAETFKVEEYKDLNKGSFDSGDPLTTNLYVGNINPKMNEEMLCQTFGKFGPLASVKVMWPRTEEERARNKNCGFVAFMKRKDAEKALEAMKGSTVMSYDIQVGWGKAVPLPPHAIYVPPDMLEEKNSKLPDPPSGLPFNAQPIKSGSSSKYGNVPPPGAGGPEEEKFEDVLQASIVKVVIPTDMELLRLIHRMIEFVIREGPMFEAMIMNKELNNPMFQFLFDNQSPAHIYYRWKLFSILNGDSPETWRTEEFRMFERGSLWKPPPLKNLLSKVLPPIEEVIKKGQLSAKHRDYLEDGLRSITVERDSIKTMMVWCLDHAESAAEIVDCISESLCILETPLPMKLARLYLVNDIVHNCTSYVPNSSSFRRGFESKLIPILEHFHAVFKSITSRIRAEQFKRRVLACLRAWDTMSVYHFNLVDKLRETFIGKSQEEVEKQRAFQTVAMLMQGEGGAIPEGEEEEEEMEGGDIDGVPLLESEPIDFSRTGGGGQGGMADLDGEPMDVGEDLDGEPLADEDIDGVPLEKEDIDGIPMEGGESAPPHTSSSTPNVVSKWDLVDYGDDSSDEEKGPSSQEQPAGGALNSKERQQLLAEIDEKKRKILREVEVKVMELSDALESAGSYTKAEIAERLQKYRDRLMQESVEPSRSPTDQQRSLRKSRSPSPAALAKYNLQNSPQRKRSHSRSPEAKKRSPSGSPSPMRRKRSKSRSPPHKRRRSSSPSKNQSRSHSPSRKRSRSRSPQRRSKSRSPTRRRSKSKSPSRQKAKSKSPTRHRSKSRSPTRRRSKSKSPTRRRSKSRSPSRRKRSRSPRKRSRSPRRHRSKSPHSHKHRSRSPKSKRSSKRRSRSRSPHKSKSSRRSRH